MLLYEDQVKLALIAGSGGRGSVSFSRNRKLPRGGPDGGNGGRGGDIKFSFSSRYKDFSQLKKQSLFKAEKGKDGAGQLQTGKKGKNLTVSVPLGTLIRDGAGQLLKDSAEAENPFLFLKGGLGGRGNAFYKSSVNQAPGKFQKGLPGEQKQVILELKPFVDFVLIGRVNTGKSTFFNKVTRGKSPVGEYPCTTLEPYYGEMKPLPFQRVLMDIPGIPKGASSDIKKGKAFLRLMGRAEVLLIFLSAEDQPVKNLKEMEQELEAFDKTCFEEKFTLKRKKKIVVLSKADRLKEERKKRILEALSSQMEKTLVSKNEILGEKPIALSLKTGEGIEKLLSAVGGSFEKPVLRKGIFKSKMVY